MTMKVYEVLVASIIAVLLPATGNAGELLNHYNQDLQKLVSEQAKSPNKVIRFTDDTGPIARVVLNISRVNSVLAEIETEINQLKTLSALSKSMQVVTGKYESAFAEKGQLYEEEYLAAFEVSLAVVKKAVEATLQSIKTVKPTDPEMSKSLDAVAKFAHTAPALMISVLTRMIDAGKFSQKGVVEAKYIVASFNQNSGQSIQSPAQTAGIKKEDWLASFKPMVTAMLCTDSPIKRDFKGTYQDCTVAVTKLFDQCVYNVENVKIPAILASREEGSKNGSMLGECIAAYYFGGEYLSLFNSTQALIGKSLAVQTNDVPGVSRPFISRCQDAIAANAIRDYSKLSGLASQNIAPDTLAKIRELVKPLHSSCTCLNNKHSTKTDKQEESETQLAIEMAALSKPGECSPAREVGIRVVDGIQRLLQGVPAVQ
jgi:hypothetical protein